MLRATRVAHEAPCFDTVTLDHDARHRRRMRLVTDGGFEFLLELPEARLLHDGDRLLLEDGRAVLVRAAPEPLLELALPRRARAAAVWRGISATAICRPSFWATACASAAIT